MARAYLLGDEFDVHALSDQSVLPNGVNVHGTDPDVVNRFRQVVERYNVWASPTVNIPEDQWFQVPMKEGWQKRLLKTKVYRLGFFVPNTAGIPD